MRTDAAGRATITQREGVRLTAYPDSRGIATIGVGHVDATPPKTVMGMTITRAQADAYLSADLAPMEAAVNAAIGKRTVSQNAFNACVSLAFNIGAHAFAGSTVARKLAGGDMAGAADAFMLWVKPPELRARREAEQAQFLTPDGHGISAQPGAPVLNGIIAAVNGAAAAQAKPAPKPAAPIVPPVAGSHLLPRAPKPGLLAWIGSLFRKAA